MIGEVWLQFEREEGTLESYEDVEEIVFNRWQDEESKEKITPEKEPVAHRKPSRKRKNEAVNEQMTEQPAFKKPMVPKKRSKEGRFCQTSSRF